MVTLTPEQIENMDARKLKQLAARGIIKVMSDKKILTKEDYPEYKMFKDLSGKPIHISAAARKYNISDASIIRYVERGIIGVIGSRKNRKLVDEQDVAYCAEIISKHGGKGKKALNDDGTPNY